MSKPRYTLTEVPNKGKSLVSIRTISSDPILSEEPVAHASTQVDNCCDSCLTVDPTGKEFLRCSGCKFVNYCSEKCQVKGWKNWHKNECKVFSHLLQQGKTPTPTLVLTHRTVVSQINGTASVVDKLSYHTSNLTSSKKDMYIQLGCLLAEMLGLTKGFRGNKNHPYTSMDSVLDLFAKLESNSFSITDDNLSTVGYGLYNNCSFINHSCEPNAVAAFNGTRIEILPIRDIPPENEILISYIELAQLTADRRNELRERYNFNCCCDRCAKTGAELEAKYNPAVLVAANDKADELIAAGEYQQALQRCVEVLPYLGLYGENQIHPSVGMHFFNISKLSWRLEDTRGTYESGMKAVQIFKKTLCSDSPLLRSAAALTSEAHQFLLREVKNL
eukprot:TRINITY_DN24559_c0_g1_i1.p1 TRINITY_DN24559_c0_g1~~TRINITY_DN24559_c0_g1_i1.p1  ORF type:complete len:404 (+),score=77.42 TRINITY_DN24559_c0_g1_i1:47-1213(+)